jgi:putative endonuclease
MSRYRCPAVYMLTNARNGTRYVGVTSNLGKRAWEHRNSLVEAFAKQFRLTLLVYYEVHGTMIEAISREKRLKRWRRAWKLALIERQNPYWHDLTSDVLGQDS